MNFRAPPPGVLRLVRLDTMTAIHDRRSNATHVVAAVVPTILAALSEGAADTTTLASRLGTDELNALAERLNELVATGLVEAL
jgi:DNA-binding HxlR family transcriptional regulator